MSEFKVPMEAEEIGEAIKGIIEKLDGIYYSKYESWKYFIENSENSANLLEDLPEDKKYDRESALNKLPLCAARDEALKEAVYSFYKKVKENNQTETDKMPLGRICEICIDWIKSPLPASKILTQSLEQFFAHGYEEDFGNLLCSALLSGWYSETINILLTRIQWLGYQKIRYFKNTNSSAQPIDNQGKISYRILEFIAIWFNECAVNMLKGVSPRNPYLTYVFECVESQRVFFTTPIDSNKQDGMNENVGRRYALLAAMFYQLDYLFNKKEFEQEEKKFYFYWNTANCYANAAHTKEAVFYADLALKLKVNEESYYEKLNNNNSEGITEKEAFCDNVMNIYYLHEKYDVEEEGQKLLKQNESNDDVELRNIIYHASAYRYSATIKAFKQGCYSKSESASDNQDEVYQHILELKNNTKSLFDKALEQIDTKGDDLALRKLIFAFYAKTIFFTDSKKKHFGDFDNPTAETIIDKAKEFTDKFNGNPLSKVWNFFTTTVLLKYAVAENLYFLHDGKEEADENKEPHETNKETYLKAAYESIMDISIDEKFLARSKFAIKELRNRKLEIEKLEEAERNQKKEDFEKQSRQVLLYMYMTFRIQDLLSVSISEIKGLKELCIYTSTDTLHKWLSNFTHKGCPLTMMNVNYFNDPREGMIVQEHVMAKQEEESEMRISPKVFLKCFTLAYDDLPMWDRYADVGKGVCLKVDSSTFGRNAAKLKTPNDCEILAARVDDSDNIYRVAYCHIKKCDDGEKFIVDDITRITNSDKKDKDDNNDKSEKRTKKEVGCLIREMKNIYASLSKEHESETIMKILDYYTQRVSYLFKSSDFISEKELRIISYYDKDAYELSGSPLPKIATDWWNKVTFKEIMFGSRMSSATIKHCTPYIQRQMEKINRWKCSSEDQFEMKRSERKVQ